MILKCESNFFFLMFIYHSRHMQLLVVGLFYIHIFVYNIPEIKGGFKYYE